MAGIIPTGKEKAPASKAPHLKLCRSKPARKKFVLSVVAAVITDSQERILITRRREDQRLAGLWEFPGGKVEAGESLAGALRREIKEEIGVDISVGQLIDVARVKYPKRSLKLLFYRAYIRSGKPSAIEVAEWKWVKRDELRSHPFPPADERLLKKLESKWDVSRWKSRSVKDQAVKEEKQK